MQVLTILENHNANLKIVCCSGYRNLDIGKEPRMYDLLAFQLVTSTVCLKVFTEVKHVIAAGSVSLGYAGDDECGGLCFGLVDMTTGKVMVEDQISIYEDTEAFLKMCWENTELKEYYRQKKHEKLSTVKTGG